VLPPSLPRGCNLLIASTHRYGSALSNVLAVEALEHEIDTLAHATRFSGTVRVDDAPRAPFARAYGLANRDEETANTVDTQYGIASGTKGLTACTVVSLISDGAFSLDTSARSILGPDLPLIPDDVTLAHLLAHTSGIGDYLDEEAGCDVDEEILPVPAAALVDTDDYLAVLDGHAPKFAAGERFSYCNSGYVVLALLAERAAGQPFAELVRTRVCEPAGMSDTAFLRSDELPPRAALGYLGVDGTRTNVCHLPMRGSGDGGIYTTATDMCAFWRALDEGRIVDPEWVAAMTQPQSDVPRGALRYGYGFWLHASRAIVMLEGCDAGVSFRSGHDPARGVTYVVVANTTDGAWPIAKVLDAWLENRR